MVSRLERLRADHRGPVLAFEQDNRAYFAAAVSDRGDRYFDEFAAGFSGLLAEQEAGVCVFHVLVDADGEVLGRFNLYDLAGGTAVLGYRVARRVAGRGVATAAVASVCSVAAGLGLKTLTAATSHDNVASQRVLAKAGFVAAGPADPKEIGGRDGIRYRLDLGDRAPVETEVDPCASSG